MDELPHGNQKGWSSRLGKMAFLGVKAIAPLGLVTQGVSPAIAQQPNAIQRIEKERNLSQADIDRLSIESLSKESLSRITSTLLGLSGAPIYSFGIDGNVYSRRMYGEYKGKILAFQANWSFFLKRNPNIDKHTQEQISLYVARLTEGIADFDRGNFFSNVDYDLRARSLVANAEHDIRSEYIARGVPATQVRKLLDAKVSLDTVQMYAAVGLPARQYSEFMAAKFSPLLVKAYLNSFNDQEKISFAYRIISDWAVDALASFYKHFNEESRRGGPEVRNVSFDEMFLLMKLILTYQSAFESKDVLSSWLEVVKYAPKKDVRERIDILEEYLKIGLSSRQLQWALANGLSSPAIEHTVNTIRGLSANEYVYSKMNQLDEGKLAEILAVIGARESVITDIDVTNIDYLYEIVQISKRSPPNVGFLKGAAFWNLQKGMVPIEYIRSLVSREVSIDLKVIMEMYEAGMPVQYFDDAYTVFTQKEVPLNLATPRNILLWYKSGLIAKDVLHAVTEAKNIGLESHIVHELFTSMYGVDSTVFTRVFQAHDKLRKLKLLLEGLNAEDRAFVPQRQLLEFADSEIQNEDAMFALQFNVRLKDYQRLTTMGLWNAFRDILPVHTRLSPHDLYSLQEAGLSIQEMKDWMSSGRNVSASAVAYFRKVGIDWKSIEKFRSRKDIHMTFEQVAMAHFLGISPESFRPNDVWFRNDEAFSNYLLEHAKPGKMPADKIKFLEHYNLTFLARYPFEIIKNMYEGYRAPERVGRPSILVVLAKSDWNTAFSDAGAQYIDLMKTHNVYFAETDSDDDAIARIVDFAQKHASDGTKPLFVLGGHGSTDGIEFSRQPRLNSSLSKFRMEKFTKYKKILAGHTVILHSCSTGKSSDNVAQELSDTLGVVTVAPDADSNIQSFNVFESGDVGVQYTHGAGAQYFVPKRNR